MKLFFTLLVLAILSSSCAKNTVATDRSLIALRVARESQDRSIQMLDLVKAQAGKAAADGKIAEKANEEIQQYVEVEREKIEEQQQKLEAAEAEVKGFRAGKSNKSQTEVVEVVNNAVLESANVIRILEKKTEVIVDFLGNETFSKSEIGALFTPGEYKLLSAQLKEGERLFSPIVQKIYTFSDKYKDSFKNLKGEIIVTGYSDATAVEKGSRLYKDLTQRLQNDNGLTEPTPADLNQKLSELRALAVKGLLEKIISTRQSKTPTPSPEADVTADSTATAIETAPTTVSQTLSIEVTVLGRGEEIPRGLPADVVKNDRRRRVVTFYWVVLPSL